MRETTVGQVLVNAVLPEDMRDYSRELTKKNVNKLMLEITQRHPEDVKDVLSQLTKIGYRGAYLTGGQSFGLKHMSPVSISKQMQKELDKEVQNILYKAYMQGKQSNDPKVKKAILDATVRWADPIDKFLDNEDPDNNPLYRQHKGTGASKPGTYRSIRAGDLVYVDQNNKPVAVPITRSYTQGLTPVQYFAAAFGARKGSVDLQKATQDSGALSKQLVQLAHRLVVVADDDPDTPFDEKNPIGYPTTVDDPDNEGSFLAVPAAGYARNTMLTPKILADMKKHGVKNIVTRSVIAGGPGNGGIYAYDAGVRERGTMPTIGDFVGINAVQGISEPITQACISCLHPTTEVRMADGSVKAIIDIHAGDVVLGCDTHGNTAPAKVTHKFNNGIQPVYLTYFNTGIGILCTTNHKVIRKDSEGNPVIAPLQDDSADCGIVSDGKLRFVSRVAQSFIKDCVTYDIEVDHPDHLFVLANGLIVSNSKHSGGVAGASSGNAIAELKHINQFLQVPKHYPEGATHSTCDGRVSNIVDAPQGGKFIFVNNERHYVRAGNVDDIRVKVGDIVESGDVMTGGLPNPAEIVKYKGIGEGRKYYVDEFRKILDKAGVQSNRRNVEALSRGLINYVRCTDEIGDYAPEDVLPYCMLAADWKPRAGFIENTPKNCKGQYLERPVLHYTIGTRITPSVIKTLDDYNIKTIATHKDPPPFEPELIRGMQYVSEDPDWGTRLLGAYNKNSILEGARRGNISNTDGTSYVPAIAFGDMEFGHHGATAQAPLNRL